jgi:hypothetical protein
MNNVTRPAPAPAKTGAFVPGTLGFDMYLAAIGLSIAAFKAPKAPELIDVH